MFELVVIVDRSLIVREGLSTLFNNNNLARQLALLESMDDYWRVMRDKSPDLIILGSEFIPACGIDRIRQKNKISPETPIIGIIYQYYDKQLTNQFTDVILITDSENNILKKLKQLSINKDENTNDDTEKLSEREKDVLKLLLTGLSNKEVAEELNISPHTVTSHRKNIIEKTGIRSLSGLAVYAIINNIADINDINNN